MQVKVLQHHIDEGVRQNGSYCAVAMALREALPEAQRIHVSSTIFVGGLQGIITPSAVIEFIKAFDSGWPVEPFTFELPFEGAE